MTRFAKPFNKFVVTKYQNTVVFDIKSEILHSGSIDQIIGFHCMTIWVNFLLFLRDKYTHDISMKRHRLMFVGPITWEYTNG